MTETATVIPPMPRRAHEIRRLSVNELAKRWGVHPETVYRMSRDELWYFHVGRQRRYRLEDIEKHEAKE